MMKKRTVSLFAACLLVFPIVSNATDSDGLKEMTREVWVDQVKKAVPEPICKSFIEDDAIAAQMTAHNITYDKCIALIPDIADKCQKKYYDSLPPIIDHDSAEKWGKLIGECIGSGFAMDNLY